MHPIHAADIAAVLAHHGPGLLYHRSMIPAEAMTAYWTANRVRFDLWHHALGHYQEMEQQGAGATLQRWWEEHLAMLEEVLLTEVLTRVYAALGAWLDKDLESGDIKPVVHSVHLSHVEARNRVLHLMLHGRGSSVDEAVRLNRLRSEVERWTDALIGALATHDPVALDYAIDIPRAATHSEESRRLPAGPARDTAHWLIGMTMRDALLRRVSNQPALPAANAQVHEAVMMCLRPDLFDSIGLCKSLWLHRIEAGAEQADRVLNELTAEDLMAGTTWLGYETIRSEPTLRWLL